MKVVSLMKEIFPEVVDAEKRVTDVLQDEEMSFNRTLDKGLKEFNKVASALGDKKWATFYSLDGGIHDFFLIIYFTTKLQWKGLIEASMLASAFGNKNRNIYNISIDTDIPLCI